jgi:hypothetical protein
MLFRETVAVYCESPEQRERKLGVVVRNTKLEGRKSGTIIFDLKVPGLCPLVLLIRVRLGFRVN